jgi:hypothetical protein
MLHVTDGPREQAKLEPVEDEQLRCHLIEDHGRAPHEIIGLPLAEVHGLEHFDEEVGMLHLRHRHTD